MTGEERPGTQDPTRAGTGDGDGGLAAEFERLRPRLFGIAYRMLGMRSEAEDMVQEAWLRLGRAAGVDSVDGFLVTAVTRLCIDHQRAARVRREAYVGPWLPEPILTAQDDPAHDAERAEALSLAVLRVLDTLDPVERAVFLLREVFDYPYAEVAALVGRREDHCRQIAHRARSRVQARRPGREPTPEEHRRLLERFMAAAEEGDLVGLEELLAEDAVLVSDGGGKATAARNPVLGRDRVARFVAGVTAKRPVGTVVVPATLNGLPGIVILVDGVPETATCLDVRDGRITSVFMMRNPEKLGALGAALSSRPPSNP